jgi:hypothetical protein
MAEQLRTELAGRVALRARQFTEARRIWQRIGAQVDALAGTAPPPRGERQTRTLRARPAPAPPAPSAAQAFVPLSYLAHELQVDPRTLHRRLAGQPFVHRFEPRTVLVDRAAYYASIGVPLR